MADPPRFFFPNNAGVEFGFRVAAFVDLWGRATTVESADLFAAMNAGEIGDRN